MVAACGVDAIVMEHFPVLLSTVHACLAVVASMAIKDRARPLAMMLEGLSGEGKTTVLQMLLAAGDSSVEEYIYRSDKFSPKAFVTHAANVEARHMQGLDLLPKLENKILITKEMAPVFRGREQDLQEIFSILISVLDGKGFTSDSGIRGKRGYETPIMFNWLGATTPLPPNTYRLMSQLGTRLLQYEVPTTDLTEDKLLEYAKKESAGISESECQRVVNNFIVSFFAGFPVASVPPESITFPHELLRSLVRWAQFLVAGRAELKYEKETSNWKPVAAARPEAPYKVVNYLKDLARGHALLHDRDRIEQSDIDLVGHVAISSIPGHLRPLIRYLRANEFVETVQAAEMCKVSRRAVLNYLFELDLLGIAALTKGSAKEARPDLIRLVGRYEWLKYR